MTSQLPTGGRLVVMPNLRAAADNLEPLLHDACILEHRWLADRYWLMRLEAPEMAERARPGQFVMLTVCRDGEWDPPLPRPMAIFDAAPAEGTIELVYGVVGRGTTKLTSFVAGERIVTVGPLGRPFHLSSETREALILGRGIGSCSLTELAREAQRRGVGVTVIDSGRHADALTGNGKFRQLGLQDVTGVTDEAGTSDTTLLRRDLVERLSHRPPQQIFVCGSARLLRLAGELGLLWDATVQVSVEAPMACGLGYCHGCSSGLRSAEPEAPLVCKDGPVFLWQPEATPGDLVAA